MSAFRKRGPIAWMAAHSVAPNLLMLALILGGLLMSARVTQEVFPQFELDSVTVEIALPGATPEEVEGSVVLAVEEAVADVSGVRKVTSRAAEGLAVVTAEIDTGTDRARVYDDVAQEVARITTLPEEAEEPQVRLTAFEPEVLELLVHGQTDEMSLRMAAERLRSQLLLEEGISRIRIDSPRAMEIQVSVPRSVLRAHDLTLQGIAGTIRQAALERAGGTVETEGGDLLVRLDDRREALDAFAEIPVVTDPRGTVLRLGDVATLSRGFESTDREATLDGAPAIRLDVYRTGGETPISVSEAVRAALPGAVAALPEGIDVLVADDSSEVFRGRMDLLLKNGFIGLVLVLILLSLFLEYRLAFWVAVGIPTAFLGTFLFLPVAGASINMVTMFAFILALGIVVDDAIVAGENIYEYRQRGMGRLEAAIEGARDIAVPLAFSILTNIAAFLPLALVPGSLGKFFVWIPLVVGAAFLLSWIEALFVLPAHLAGVRERQGPPRAIDRVRRRFSAGLSWVTERLYAPALRIALGWRYATAAAMLAIALVVLAVPVSGKMGFSLFPPVPRDVASATVSLPVSASTETARAVRDRMVAAARRVVEENGGETLSRGIFARIDGPEIALEIYLTDPETRPISTDRVRQLWSEAVGPIPEARASRYRSSFGGPGGESSVQLQLSHPETEPLAAAAGRIAEALSALEGVRDPDTGFTPGKEQLAFRLTEAGRVLGLTSAEVGTQVRSAFFGAEALSQQEGRNEVTVRVRLPEAERRSEAAIETFLVATPDDGWVPLYQIAEVERSRAEAAITRENGRRIVTVTADVDPDSASPAVVRALEEEILPRVAEAYPGLGWTFGGRQEAVGETREAFVTFSIPLTLGLLYALLAIPFRSYVQPAIVLTAIPFGVVGAVLGHMLMGMSLSMISIFGIVALSGVVINAAIVMIDYANRARIAGAEPFEAIRRAGVRRFRPILLTTLTTFGGLAPMIFETSAQARFLIPMAVSLGYGILFATLIVLFLIPALYLIVEDLTGLVRRAPPPEPEPDETEAGGRPLAAE